MPYFASANHLKGGPNYLAANCDLIGVVAVYSAGDSYATVTANLLASTAMAPSDFPLTESSLNILCTTAAGKQDASADASEVSSHIVFLKTTATTEVLLVVPETNLVNIVAGQPVNFPSIPVTYHQPTA